MPSLIDEYATRKELAAELGISVATLIRLDGRREGPPRQILGGRVLYHRELARDWLRKRLNTQAASAPPDMPKGPGGVLRS